MPRLTLPLLYPLFLKGSNAPVLRLVTKRAVIYKMTVNAVIDKTTMKDLLHCNQNREALAIFLATQPIKCKKDSQTTYVVNSKGDCVVSNTVPIQHLRSGQEEADTRMLLHALDRYRCTRSDVLNLLETLSGYYSDCRDRRKRKKYSLVPCTIRGGEKAL